MMKFAGQSDKAGRSAAITSPEPKELNPKELNQESSIKKTFMVSWRYPSKPASMTNRNTEHPARPYITGCTSFQRPATR